MTKPQYLVYFSHSWLPQHVDVNLAFWKHLWQDCLLLVDDNSADDPPYVVSRLEYLVRRSDAFIALLLPPQQNGAHAVSPFVSFEIALAERAQLPRLIVYDESVGYEPPGPDTATVRHVPVRFSELTPEGPEHVWRAVADWLSAVTSATPPRTQTPHMRAAVIVPGGSAHEMFGTIEATLRAHGYLEVRDVLSASNDADMLAILRSTDLLVADIGAPPLWDVCGLSHALAIPTIRVAQTDEIPMILRGHREGYHRDIIRCENAHALSALLAVHASAIRHAQDAVDTWEKGREYFERRRDTNPIPAWT